MMILNSFLLFGPPCNITSTRWRACVRACVCVCVCGRARALNFIY